jgi:hypothetical protein
VLEILNKMLSERRSAGDQRAQAALLNTLGLIYSTMGEQTKALDYFNQALLLNKAIGNRSGESAYRDVFITSGVGKPRGISLECSTQ